MKNLILFLLILFVCMSCGKNLKQNTSEVKQSLNQIIDSTDMTNNFYDNVETHTLPVKDIMIDGEISNPGKVDFSELPVRSVIVKETLLDSAGGDKFVGAYRYDGYSLFDILNNAIVNKVNSKEFRSVIDLYVEIENEKGDRVTFSWGEIFYPNDLHKIIIAKDVARIVPSKTKQLWPLPLESKLVTASDLITERNIYSPVRITVKSFPHSFIVQQGMSPMYSSGMDLYISGEKVKKLEAIPQNCGMVNYNTIFYGRGKGIHSTTPFEGYLLKDILSSSLPLSRKNLMTGILCIAGKDGYRSVVSYSELFNRNDQREFMLVRTKENEDGGLFRIFAAADFFSDRAVKSVSEIHLIN